MRNKVVSLPLFYLVAQHSFQGGTHCCKPHLTKCFWSSWLFKFCKHIHLQHHQSRNNHHGCCRYNPADAPRPQCSAFHPWRKQEVWHPRNATRTTVVPLYIPAVCIVDYILDGFRTCLQTTVAALMSQPSSQTGPKKPSLFTANTLPESSSSPCLLSNSTDLYLDIFVLYFLYFAFFVFCIAVYVFFRSEELNTQQGNLLVLTSLQLYVVYRVWIGRLVQFCTFALHHSCRSI